MALCGPNTEQRPFFEDASNTRTPPTPEGPRTEASSIFPAAAVRLNGAATCRHRFVRAIAASGRGRCAAARGPCSKMSQCA